MKLFKRLTAAALAVSMTLSAAAFQGITAFAADTSLPTTYGGWYETAYATWPDTAAKSATVSYRLASDTGYTEITGDDVALIRQIDDSTGRVDIPGLAAGAYYIKIVTSGSETQTYEAAVTVLEEDRSGYAHFNRGESEGAYSGVGAYNDDGTPKDGATIIYVTEATKNSVTLTAGGTTYEGIGNIASKIQTISHALNTPIIIRVVGKVSSSEWIRDDENSIIYEDTTTSSVSGLINKITHYKGTDTTDGAYAYADYTLGSYTSSLEYETSTTSGDGNTSLSMMDFKHAGSTFKDEQTCFSNITFEGIGTDAEIENFGVSFQYCNSVEVKNLTFSSYPEDGCAVQNANRIWLHRCTFNVGKNSCDLSSDQDKSEGDGSSDMNECKYVTLAYNVYNNCHKTSLNGGGNKTTQYNYTYHHNYYNGCTSRLPLSRYVNLHSYNNYTYGADSGISARASAFVFSEANYYSTCKYALETQADSTYGYGFIKSYGDTIVDSTNTSKYPGGLYENGTSDGTTYCIHITSSRTESFTLSNSKHTDTDDAWMDNFDTNSTYFYYDDTNNVSDVSYLTSASDAVSYVTTYSGVLKDDTSYTAVVSKDDDSDPDAVIEDTAELTFTNTTGSDITLISNSTDYSNYFTLLATDATSKGKLSGNLAIGTSSSKTFADYAKYEYCVKSGGTTTYTSNIPTARAIKFETSGAGIVQLLGTASGDGSDRYAYVYNSGGNASTDNCLGTLTVNGKTNAIVSKLIELPSAGTYYITFSGAVSLYSVKVAVGVSKKTDSSGSGYIITDSSDSYIVAGTTISSDNFTSYSDLTITVTADNSNSIDKSTDTVYAAAVVDDFIIQPSELGDSYTYIYIVKIEDSNGATDFTYSSNPTPISETSEDEA